ncbi:MAG TPA: ADP-ribosylglycohydrolase family protein [Polyangiaceae bacterium]|jgi:ADP-ribosylglycohydrolase|nr:ADP-ribosylglycohydrolase family protein [Polyangiaceae bacterium]
MTDADDSGLDPHVRRIIEGARRADEIRSKYRIDMKMTFFGPGSRPDDLGNVCPICLARTPTSERYPDYVCESCTGRAVDETGRRIVFGNAGISGGIVARVDGEKRDASTCLIDGRQVVVHEARFGGVVYALAGVHAPNADPSRRGNHLAERVTGAVLGAAIGDAMGRKRVAPYTDDTELAEVVLTSLLDARLAGEALDPAMTRLARAIVKWSESPQGSGSVMRAYPVGLVFHSDAEAREAWAVAQSQLTHRAPIALAASSAMAHGTASALAGDAVRDTVDVLVQSAARHDVGTADMIARAAAAAHDGQAPETVLERLRGWAAHEAIAAATYVYVRHPDEFRVAVLEAANTPGDSDTIATLVGALVGARCGTNAIPPEWLRDVERADALAALATRTLRESGYIDWDDVLAQLRAADS